MLACSMHESGHCSSQHQDVMHLFSGVSLLFVVIVALGSLTPSGFLCVCRPIMSLSNCLMYDGRLECGSERTASARPALPFTTGTEALSSFSLCSTRWGRSHIAFIQWNPHKGHSEY